MMRARKAHRIIARREPMSSQPEQYLRVLPSAFSSPSVFLGNIEAGVWIGQTYI